MAFLCVIKDCGPEGKGMLSFPRPGISIALDFPIRPNQTQTLVDRLNELVIAEGGRLTDQVAHVIDIVPTCLEAARSRYPAVLAGWRLTPPAGQSLLPVFEGREMARDPVFWEHEGNRAVRDGKWKLVSRYPGHWELYDLEADRTETNDLAEKFPAVVEGLSRAYAAWAKKIQVEQWRK